MNTTNWRDEPGRNMSDINPEKAKDPIFNDQGKKETLTSEKPFFQKKCS